MQTRPAIWAALMIAVAWSLWQKWSLRPFHPRDGQVVHLTGTLVDATRDDGAWIRTSLTRSDSGAGACEVMLVESVKVE
jgi:hypothetical protein